MEMGIIDDMKKEVKKELEVAEEKAKNVVSSVEEEAKKEGVGILDVLSEKVLSRKLMVWIVATTLLGFGKITPDEWMGISLGYIGVQGVADLATKWKTAGK